MVHKGLARTVDFCVEMRLCPECNSKVRYDTHNREYSCTNCGLVMEEVMFRDVIRVAPERLRFFTKPGTWQCELSMQKINARIANVVIKPVDAEIMALLGKDVMSTKELWEALEDWFSSKDEFYETLRRLRNHKKIKQGYVLLRN